jgi:peptidoglycan/LPS O-acetylase OafA/YrhL
VRRRSHSQSLRNGGRTINGRISTVINSHADHWIETIFALGFIIVAAWSLKSNPHRVKREIAYALFAALPLTAAFRNNDSTPWDRHTLLIIAGLATLSGCVLLVLDTRTRRVN